MPKNCSRDIDLVIEHLDHVLTNGTAAEIYAAKAMFELESPADAAFMGALSLGPLTWGGGVGLNYSSFATFCDYVENSERTTDLAKLPSANSVGLKRALTGYAEWWKQIGSSMHCEAVLCYDPPNTAFG
jgi:hypothetical protein